MKTTVFNTRTKKMLLGVFTLLIAFSLGSYAQKVPFLTSSVVPAAKGYVKVKSDNDNNYVIKIHLTDLAGIERIQPAKKSYVAWMVTDREITKNIGRLNSSDNLNVDFETVSSFKPVQIFITAEVDESAQYPDAQVVLTTDKFWEDR